MKGLVEELGKGTANALFPKVPRVPLFLYAVAGVVFTTKSRLAATAGAVGATRWMTTAVTKPTLPRLLLQLLLPRR